MQKEGFCCFKSNKIFTSFNILIRHLSLNYPYLSKYECKQSECTRSFNTINNLKKHYLYSHSTSSKCSIFEKKTQYSDKNELIPSCLENENVTHNVKQDLEIIKNLEILDINNAVINFIAKLYNNPTINRKIVQTVFTDTSELFNNIFNYILGKVSDARDVSSNILREEHNAINRIFESFKTEYLRLKYFETSNTFIRSRHFHIGSQTVLDNISTPGVPGIKYKADTGQKLPIQYKLKMFLELPNVYNEVLKYTTKESLANDGVISSIIHGSLWKKLQNNFKNKVFFPLMLFYDDFEPCNPLGSRAVIYKIGAVYITLLCIPPKYSSTLDNIFLAQLTYANDREFYGNYKVFHNLIDDLKTLEDKGIDLVINNEVIRVYFPLLLIAGDNLGLNSLLGFSESFSADYFCRLCISHRTVTRVEINSKKFIPRTTENYNVHCTESTYGVKQKYIWNELTNFHVTSNVYCDLMHDMLEGVLRYDMAFLINDLIKKQYFDLNHLNRRIKFFKFTKADRGSPMPLIKNDHLKKKYLVMSASEMLSLSLYFGVLVGDLVDSNEPTWEFYKVMREMLELMLCRSFTKDRIQYLETMIEEHHRLVSELFKEPLKPKIHNILHYPEIISKIGPLRNIWCMKFEAYHKLLKSTINATTCHKNILLTLIIKDSLRFSQRILSKKGFSKIFDFHVLDQISNNFSDCNFLIDFSNNAFAVSWLKVDDIFYKCNFIIKISSDIEIMPQYGQIKHIILDNENVWFVVSKIKTIQFLTHICAYEIKFTQDQQSFDLYNYNSLCDPYPYSIHYSGDGKSVVVRI